MFFQKSYELWQNSTHIRAGMLKVMISDVVKTMSDRVLSFISNREKDGKCQ